MKNLIIIIFLFNYLFSQKDLFLPEYPQSDSTLATYTVDSIRYVINLGTQEIIYSDLDLYKFWFSPRGDYFIIIDNHIDDNNCTIKLYNKLGEMVTIYDDNKVYSEVFLISDIDGSIIRVGTATGRIYFRNPDNDWQDPKRINLKNDPYPFSQAELYAILTRDGSKIAISVIEDYNRKVFQKCSGLIVFDRFGVELWRYDFPNIGPDDLVYRFELWTSPLGKYFIIYAQSDLAKEEWGDSRVYFLNEDGKEIKEYVGLVPATVKFHEEADYVIIRSGPGNYRGRALFIRLSDGELLSERYNY